MRKMVFATVIILLVSMNAYGESEGFPCLLGSAHQRLGYTGQHCRDRFGWRQTAGPSKCLASAFVSASHQQHLTE